MGLLLLALALGEARLGFRGITSLGALIPVALAVVRGGPAAGGLAAAVAVAGASFLIHGVAGTVVALRHAAPGLILGVVLARRWPLPLALVAVSAASLLGLVILLGAYLPAGTPLLALLDRQVEAQVARFERLPGQLGMVSDPAWAADSARLVASTMRVAGPAIVLVGVFLVALANYVGARFCVRGDGYRPFAAEAVPDHLVWGVVAGGLMLASRHDTIGLVGLNLLIVLVPLYALQGLAVVRHFLQKARVPRPLQAVSFGLFAIQPLLLLAVACFGLSDLWLDFRKIRRAPTPA